MNSLYRLFFLIFIFFSFVIGIHSQPVFGFQGGINASALSGSTSYDDDKLRFGITAYVFTDIPLGHHSIVSIETGLAYSMQGAKHETTYTEIGLSTKMTVHDKLNYVVLPVYLKENYSNFYTKIGPYGAYLLSAEQKWKKEETSANVFVKDTTGYNLDFANNVSKYDVGLSFGFGFIHFFDPVRGRNRRHRSKRTPIMQVDFKYNMGFIKLDQSGTIPDMSLRNNTFTLGLTFTSIND